MYVQQEYVTSVPKYVVITERQGGTSQNKDKEWRKKVTKR